LFFSPLGVPFKNVTSVHKGAYMGDEYETSDPLTFGGASGLYAIPSPYNSECEWCIISACALGTLSSAASYVVGSKNPGQAKLAANGTDVFGSISQGRDNNNALQSYVGSLTSQASMVTYGGDNYMPLPSPSLVYLQTNAPANSEVLVTIQFRRLLERILPDKPRVKPQTHSHVKGRRDHRTMMEGYAAQYPQEGQPYQHQGLPLQDASIARRGVSPTTVLSPTNVKHRGTNNGR
jgi:hypothetical protein